MTIRDCPSYLGYSIDESGHVFTHRKRFGKGKGHGGGVIISPDYSKTLKPYEGHGGYMFVAISTVRGQRSIAVHSLLADAFIGPCPVGQEVRHLDGNRKNNDLPNLVYGTPQDNAQDTVRYGGLKGSNHPRALLTEQIVITLRGDYKAGRRICDLARDYGINRKTITSIVHGRNWTHVAT